MSTPNNPGNSSATPLITWTCTTNRSKQLSDVYPSGVTAGEEFQLECQGQQVQWTQAPHFEVSEADQFRLVLIQPIKMSSLDASLLVASYKIDETNPLGPVVLSDGISKVTLQGIDLKSQSVLPKDKEAKPFGPRISKPGDAWNHSGASSHGNNPQSGCAVVRQQIGGDQNLSKQHKHQRHRAMRADAAVAHDLQRSCSISTATAEAVKRIR